MGRKKPLLTVIGSPQKSNRADEMIAEEAQDEALRFIEEYNAIKGRCESPIEELLMAALYINSRHSEYDVQFFLTNNPNPEPYFYGTAFVYQQVAIGPYRVDILVHDATQHPEIAPSRWMVVECDGHDFHERTKEQARRDKQRDRFFQSKGYKVLRFTGSEIWADPDKCADEIIDQLAANDAWRNRPQ